MDQIATLGASIEQSKPTKAASKKRPYRLAERSKLTSEPPFTVAKVRVLLAEAAKGRVAQIEQTTINRLTATLNNRAAFFLLAQQERAHGERRARAMVLIAELRKLLPLVLADIERLTDDFFTRHTKAAAKDLHEAVASDRVEVALPQLNLSATGWQWVAPSLAADLVPCLGTSATVRFLTAAIPLLSGENPKPVTIETWLRQHKIAA